MVGGSERDFTLKQWISVGGETAVIQCYFVPSIAFGAGNSFQQNIQGPGSQRAYIPESEVRIEECKWYVGGEIEQKRGKNKRTYRHGQQCGD